MATLYQTLNSEPDRMVIQLSVVSIYALPFYRRIVVYSLDYIVNLNTCYGHVLLDLYEYQNSYAALQVNVVMTSTRCHGDDDGC